MKWIAVYGLFYLSDKLSLNLYFNFLSFFNGETFLGEDPLILI